MCGRFTLTIDTLSALAALLGVAVDPRLEKHYRPRWNVAPTQRSLMLVAEPGGARRLVEAAFGIRWPAHGDARIAPQINARAESVSAPTKLRALGDRRCIVPADGFYEWSGPRSDRQPFWFRAQGGGLLLFAGIHHRAPEGEGFAIVTTAANELVAEVHDRMPAVLSPTQAKLWLESDDLALAAAQLRTAPADALEVRRVSKRASDVANDDAACVEPVAPRARPSARRGARTTDERQRKLF